MKEYIDLLGTDDDIIKELIIIEYIISKFNCYHNSNLLTFTSSEFEELKNSLFKLKQVITLLKKEFEDD